MNAAARRPRIGVMAAVVVGALFAVLAATAAAAEVQQRLHEASSRVFLDGADRACHPTRSRP